MILDIGCGEFNRADIRVDFRKTKCTNLIADARRLPFVAESFDKVISSDVIEHFSHREIQKVVNEWVRVLKGGGSLDIACPDLRARAFIFFLNPSWKNIENVYGGQDYAGNYHKCGFSYELLKSILESGGIENVKRIIKGYKGIPFVPDCLHVKGTKTRR
jgi:predicted SAM-dependent methyltransferase